MTHDVLLDQIRQETFHDFQELDAPAVGAADDAEPTVTAVREPPTAIKMIVSEWSVDEFGNRSREIRARD
jgi:hypothetical protein